MACTLGIHIHDHKAGLDNWVWKSQTSCMIKLNIWTFQESWLSWGDTGRKWEGTATICNCQWFPKYTELGSKDETRQNQLPLCWSNGLPIRYSSFRFHAFSCMTFVLNNEMAADLIRLQYTSRTVVVRVTKTHTGNELLWYSFISYYIF